MTYVCVKQPHLRRTFGIDPEICICGKKMKVVESTTDSDDIAKAMAEMGLSSTPPPLGRKRREPGELDYFFDAE